MKTFIGVSAALIGLSIALAGSTPRAASALHPIVDVQSGYLIGGSKNGKWISAKEVAKSLQGSEAYRVFGISTPLGKTESVKTRTGQAPCEETFWVDLQKNFNGNIALSANWNPVPRRPRPQSTSQKFYRNEVARVLKAGGIKKPKVVVTQLWRVDLDGDKTEEVLLSATHYANPRNEKPAPNYVSSNAVAGDYSLILLRKVVGKKVRTITLTQEIYAQNKEFSAPNIYTLSGVYDLNGDGKMEIVLRGQYYEGNWTSVLEVQGAKVKEVLAGSCGA